MNRLPLITRLLLFYGSSLPDHPLKWKIHSQLRGLLKVSVDWDVDVSRKGLNWTLNPADFEHESLFWLDELDKWDIYHLGILLRPGAVFYDIGANFGYYSMRLAHTLRKQCRVHAFEPNPKTYDRLCRHISINNMTGIVTAHRLALSDKQGTGNLIERHDNSGASRLGEDAAGIAVEVTTLDEFCGKHAVKRIDAIKMDVEGYEARVLEGARKTLTRFKPILVIEFWTPGLERADASVDDIARVVCDMGYKLYSPVRKHLEQVDELPRGIVPVNLFAFHNG